MCEYVSVVTLVFVEITFQDQSRSESPKKSREHGISCSEDDETGPIFDIHQVITRECKGVYHMGPNPLPKEQCFSRRGKGYRVKCKVCVKAEKGKSK